MHIPIDIAIPSHRRSDRFSHCTLDLLNRAGLTENVSVWVSDEIDYQAYKNLGVKIVRPPSGQTFPDLASKLNDIHYHYPVGSAVVVMEDDLQEFVQKQGSKTKNATVELNKALQVGFGMSMATGGNLWGFSATANGFFMSPKDSYNLRLIVGYCYGFFSNHQHALQVTMSHKHDYERTCLYWETFGSLYRMNNYGFTTRPYKTAGGLHTTEEERRAAEEASVEMLLEKFPQYLKRNKARKSIYPELKFIKQ